MARLVILPTRLPPGSLGWVDEPQGIYRGEVLAIMGALGDIYAATYRILELLEDEGEEGDEAEEVDS